MKLKQLLGISLAAILALSSVSLPVFAEDSLETAIPECAESVSEAEMDAVTSAEESVEGEAAGAARTVNETEDTSKDEPAVGNEEMSLNEQTAESEVPDTDSSLFEENKTDADDTMTEETASDSNGTDALETPANPEKTDSEPDFEEETAGEDVTSDLDPDSKAVSNENLLEDAVDGSTENAQSDPVTGEALEEEQPESMTETVSEEETSSGETEDAMPVADDISLSENDAANDSAAEGNNVTEENSAIEESVTTVPAANDESGIYTVTIHANGGYLTKWDYETCDNIKVDTMVLTSDYGSCEIENPKNDDPYQKFAGWGIDDSHTIDISANDCPGSYTYFPEEDTDFYAIWTSSYEPVEETKSGTCGDNLTWSLNTEGELRISGTGSMGNPTWNESDDVPDIPWADYDHSITSLVIDDGVTTIKRYAFSDFVLIKSVTLPASLKEIGECAFSRCESLTSIDIPDQVTHIHTYAFSECNNLTKVNIPSSVTNLGSCAFYYCEALSDIDILCDLKNIELGADIFSGTKWQNSMGEFPIYDTVLFRYRGEDETVIVPDGVTRICTFAFEDTESITKIVLPDSLVQIDNEAFCWCFGLEEITIPSSVTTISDSAFDECINLERVVLSSGVKEIEDGAFFYCKSLESITIPESVTSISPDAFSECPKDFAIFGVPGSYAEQYAIENGIIFCNIDAVDISSANVTIKSQPYTGKALTPSPTVKIGNTVLVKGTDYIVNYSNNTNAGTATVSIIGIGNYKGKIKKTFTISKIAQSIKAKASASPISVGKTATVTVSGAKGKKSFKSSNKAIATVNSAGKVTAKKVGTVKITATSAATTNYKAASATVTIKVVPAATASITALNQTTGIKLTWKKVTGANGYHVYRNGTKIATLSGNAKVTYTDKKANTNGAKYTYKIVAKASTGTSKLSKTLAAYRVARPSVSSVKNSASKKMTVKWGKNAKATGYQIQYNTNKAFSSGNKTVTVKGKTSVSKVISSLKKGKTYYVRIRTYKTAGGKNYFSAWSAAKSVKIKK